MKKLTIVLLSILVTSCGGSGGGGSSVMSRISVSPINTVIASDGQCRSHVRLGNTRDRAQGQWYETQYIFNEVGGGSWRACQYIPPNCHAKISASVHIRSGDGSWHSRIGNKYELWRMAPGEPVRISIDSEALREDASYKRFDDGSRAWISIDDNPVPNQPNSYAVKIACIDSVQCEVSYGSEIIVEPHITPACLQSIAGSWYAG